MSGIDRQIAEFLGVTADVDRVSDQEDIDVLSLAAELGRVETLSPETRFLLAAALSGAKEFRSRCLLPHDDENAADLRPIFDPNEADTALGTSKGGLVWVCSGTPEHRTPRMADVYEKVQNA